MVRSGFFSVLRAGGFLVLAPVLALLSHPAAAQVLSVDKVVYTDEFVAGFGNILDAFPASVNDSGDVAFLATAPGIPDPICGLVHFTATPSPTLTPLVVDGFLVPSIGQPVFLCPRADIVVMNNNGDIAFQARVGSNVGPDAVFLWTSAGIVEVARLGDASPRPTGGTLGSPILLDLNDNQEVLFKAFDSNLGVGIWRWDPTNGLTASKSVVEGDLAVGGGSYSIIETGSLNDSGLVIFNAQVQGGSIPQGLFLTSFLGTTNPVDTTTRWAAGKVCIGGANAGAPCSTNGNCASNVCQGDKFVHLLDPIMPASLNDNNAVAFFAQSDGPHDLGFFQAGAAPPFQGLGVFKVALNADPSLLGDAFDCGLAVARGTPNYLDNRGNVVLLGCHQSSPTNLFGVFVFPWILKVSMTGDSLPSPLSGSFEAGKPFRDASISQNGRYVSFTGQGTASSCTTPPCGGVFLAEIDTTDTDGDGLLDGWEINGIDEDGDGTVDLPIHVGPLTDPNNHADPNHADLFLEIDYMDCSVSGGDCGSVISGCSNNSSTSHTHQPIQAAVDNVIAAFDDAPVSNPDGTSGIRLHVEIDEAIQHTCLLGFNPTQPTPCDPPPPPGTYESVKCAHFGTSTQRSSAAAMAAKRKVSRYGLFNHQKAANNTSSGEAEIWGNDFFVSLGGFTNTGPRGSQTEQEGTLMHEFGHTLGLRHGGWDDINFKPNYLSVMNYNFQLGSRVPRGTRGMFGSGSFLDYSRWDLLPSPTSPCSGTAGGLDEMDLDEGCGIDNDSPPASPAGFSDWETAHTYVRLSDMECKQRIVDAQGDIDWNVNMMLEGVSQSGPNVMASLHDTVACLDQRTLDGFEDWSKLRFPFTAASGYSDGAASGPFPPEPEASPDPDSDLDGRVDIVDNCEEIPNPLQEDVDGDIHGDVCDNCPDTPNPFQLNGDGDAAGDLCDCSAANPEVTDPVDTIGDSVAFNAVDHDLIEWAAHPQAEFYFVYQGSITSGVPFAYNHACLTPGGIPGPMFSVTADPPLNDALYLLVSGGNAGCGESDLGTDSALVPRPNLLSCLSGSSD